MPSRTAPAWPDTPPPATVASTSNLSAVSQRTQRRPDLHAQGFAGEERFELATVDFDGPGAGAEEHAGGRRLAPACCVILRCCCCHVTRPRAWTVSAPRADDPDRRTPSTCDTSQ